MINDYVIYPMYIKILQSWHGFLDRIIFEEKLWKSSRDQTMSHAVGLHKDIFARDFIGKILFRNQVIRTQSSGWVSCAF